jgi:hypothetical protein
MSATPDWAQDAVLESVAPKSHKATKSNDSPYDFEYFEDLAGEGTSESAFCTARFDLRKSGVLDADLPMHGHYDRLKGIWVNPDRSTVTTAQLLARLER